MPPTTGSGIEFDWINDPHLAETIGTVWGMAYPFLSVVVAVLLFAILFDHIMGVLGRFLNVFFYGDNAGNLDGESGGDGESGDYSGNDDGPDIENVLGSNIRNNARGNQVEQILWDRPKGFSFPTFAMPQFFKPGLAASARPGFNQTESYGHNQAESYGSNQAELYGGQSTGSNVGQATSQVEPAIQTPMEQPATDNSSLTDRYPMLRLVRLTGWLTK
jgi:hypothetical protein